MTDSGSPVGLFVGLATLDIIHPVRRLPGPNEKVTATDQALATGGPAANAAVTFAHRGGRATLATVVGRHPLTGIVRADLAEHRVRLFDAAPNRDRPPAVSAIAVTAGTGDRAVIAHYPPLDAVTLPDELAGLAAGSDIVLFDGHHPVLAAVAADAARHAGRRTVLDGGRWRPTVEQLLPMIDVAICCADFRPPGCTDDDAVFDYLARFGVRWAAITHGGEPIRWRTDGRSARELPVPAVPVVDTLGAGDVLHGSFCRALAVLDRTGAPLTEAGFTGCVARAAQDAAQSCTFFGSRAWLAQ